MISQKHHLFILFTSAIGLSLLINSCTSVTKSPSTEAINLTEDSTKSKSPSDVLPFLDKWKILLGNGESTDQLNDYDHKKFFYVTNDGKNDWVVYKTPNSGITSKTSSNTRTELGQKERWLPKKGGKLTGDLKVMHVSTSGDARVAASFSVVVGQIHSDEGHENEPLKIFYKKFPGHSKGSVFWNYEINTEGDNSKRWDYSTAVWGYDLSVVGTDKNTYPDEPEDGVPLGEEFSYEVNVVKGIMYLTFTRDGYAPKTFTKNLISSEYKKRADIPEQILSLYASIERDGIEQENGYQGELQFFKQGAYNQTNGKDPNSNMVWSTGAEVYNGDIDLQYKNGSYVEVWFKNASLSSGTNPIHD